MRFIVLKKYNPFSNQFSHQKTIIGRIGLSICPNGLLVPLFFKHIFCAKINTKQTSMKKIYILLLMVGVCLFSLIPNSYGQPVFRSTPVPTATVGVPYRYYPSADDGTTTAPTMTSTTKPAWMTFTAGVPTKMETFGEPITRPGGIALDGDGNTYVVNFSGSGRFIHKIAADGTTNTQWAAVDDGTINAMKVDGGYLYVSYFVNNSTATPTSCIKKISLTNPAAGQTMVYDAGVKNRLMSLVFRGGFIYCADYGGNQILKIDPTNGMATPYVVLRINLLD